MPYASCGILEKPQGQWDRATGFTDGIVMQAPMCGKTWVDIQVLPPILRIFPVITIQKSPMLALECPRKHTAQGTKPPVSQWSGHAAAHACAENVVDIQELPAVLNISLVIIRQK